jgi:predicted RNase H-like HicB family nuclease
MERMQAKFGSMKSTYTAIVKNDGDWWIGWIEEVPGVNAQERTKEELISSLRETLAEALEFNRAEARSAAESNYTEELVTV